MRKDMVPDCTADCTREEYVRARLITARCSGEMQSPWISAAWIAAALLLGMLSLSEIGQPGYRAAVAAVFFAAAACLAGLFFWWIPVRLRNRARQEFETFRQLRLPMRFRFREDGVETTSALLSCFDSYARIRELIETPELLIFRRDGTGFFLLPKRCLPPDTAQQSLRLLREEFARHRRTMKTWIF